jgi:hypothetical protein
LDIEGINYFRKIDNIKPQNEENIASKQALNSEALEKVKATRKMDKNKRSPSIGDAGNLSHNVFLRENDSSKKNKTSFDSKGEIQLGPINFKKSDNSKYTKFSNPVLN